MTGSAPRRRRLGIHFELPYRRDEGGFSTHIPFIRFVLALRPHFDDLVLIGRVDSEPGREHYAVPFVVLREARGGRQQSAGSHLGQRELAHLQRGQAMARISQPRSQEERVRSEDREPPSSEAKSVTQCHIAQVGTRQAQGRRTRPIARSLRARRQSLPGIWLSALRASLRSPEGRLIMH